MDAMIKLFLISWTAFVLAEFDTMAQCLIVQEKIDADTYYSEFRTLCINDSVFNASRQP